MLIQGRQCTCRDREYVGNPCPLPSNIATDLHLLLQHFYAFPQRVWESFFDFFCFSEPCNWDGCTGLLQHTKVWSEPQTALPGPMNTASLGSTTKWSEPQGVKCMDSPNLPWLSVSSKCSRSSPKNCPSLLQLHLPHLLTFISNPLAGVSELIAPPSFRLLLEQPCQHCFHQGTISRVQDISSGLKELPNSVLFYMALKLFLKIT